VAKPISKVRLGGQRLGTPSRLGVRQIRLLLEMLSHERAHYDLAWR
jgi:hypothetical protein